jgi:hypothetical protein
MSRILGVRGRLATLVEGVEEFAAGGLVEELGVGAFGDVG